MGPIAGLEIVALPYDAKGLLDSLEQAATVAHPDFSELETELRAFRRKDPASVTTLSSEWAEARQAVTELADSLQAMERGTEAYARAYARFRTAYDDLGREEAVLEGRMRRELGSDRELALRAGAAADSLRRWEAEAYRTLQSLVAEYDELGVTTDSLGRAHVSLKAGMWWLVARHPDPENPFMEFAWHVPVVVSSIVPVATHLSDHNVTLRWRR
jgi:chromosome segregation ATPase